MTYVYIISILVLLGCIFIFNRLIEYKNMLKKAISSINVQLKKRYNLVPSLIETVEGYSLQEKELFENITNICNRSITLDNIEEKNEKEKAFTKSFKKIYAIAEEYPDIKTNDTFVELQQDLVEIEDDLHYEKRYYNKIVKDYNILIESFPINIIAAIFNFKKQAFFDIEYIIQRENTGINL